VVKVLLFNMTGSRDVKMIMNKLKVIGIINTCCVLCMIASKLCN